MGRPIGRPILVHRAWIAELSPSLNHGIATQSLNRSASAAKMSGIVCTPSNSGLVRKSPVATIDAKRERGSRSYQYYPPSTTNITGERRASGRHLLSRRPAPREHERH